MISDLAIAALKNFLILKLRRSMAFVVKQACKESIILHIFFHIENNHE